jgi:hypothetical protein
MRTILATCLLCAAASLASAQSQFLPGDGTSEGSFIPGVGYDYSAGYGSSTYEEGVQRGFADVVRSAGAANLMNSEAAKNYEDARKKYIENRLQATETYFEMRRANQESRAALRPRPLSTEQYVRLARQQAPERLSVSQLDPLSGTIGWPRVLMADRYKEDRELLQTLFKERARGVAHNYEEIREACDALLAKLKADTAKIGANDFIRAKNFVDSLSYEVRLAQG